ncbi:MAG: hypothetical protein KJ822_04065 [Proteobacteria bacterium]|nr:hypothetical protein [Pseudomonadota bacterium]MBU4354506.1 hypothetical protein [Pseudomonadota bacterium]
MRAALRSPRHRTRKANSGQGWRYQQPAVGNQNGGYCGSFLLFAHALLKPEAFAHHGQDMGMMGQPVQQGLGQLFAAEHLWLLREVLISGHDERLPLVALGHRLEEELCSLFGFHLQPISSMINKSI